jgi:hypothetical protein
VDRTLALFSACKNAFRWRHCVCRTAAHRCPRVRIHRCFLISVALPSRTIPGDGHFANPDCGLGASHADVAVFSKVSHLQLSEFFNAAPRVCAECDEVSQLLIRLALFKRGLPWLRDLPGGERDPCWLLCRLGHSNPWEGFDVKQRLAARLVFLSTNYMKRRIGLKRMPIVLSDRAFSFYK